MARYGRYYTDNSAYYDDVAAGKYWGEPAAAPPEWWAGLERVVNKIMITCGEKEVFCDDVVGFMERLEGVEAVRKGWCRMEKVVGSGEVHDEPLMDFGLVKDEGGRLKESTRRVTEFLERIV